MGKLHFIGLGLYDEKDISVKGLEVVRKAGRVFMEDYTSMLAGTNRERMEEFYGRKIELLDRKAVEDGSVILDSARETDVVLLVVGDALTATTHDSLRLEALRSGIDVNIIHGASISTAVSLLGLQSYRFGRTTTLVFPEENYCPTSPYEIIGSNRESGLHSLVLLDIRADEDRYMTIHDALDVLAELENRMAGDGKGGLINAELPLCAICRAGSPEPFLWYGTMEEAAGTDFGPPLHTLVVPAEPNFAEKEFLEEFTK
jgi:diphthine synthase